VSSAASSGAPTESGDARAWVSTLGRVAVAIATAAVIAVTMAFLLLPVIALVTYQPLHDLIDGIRSPVAVAAIEVTARTNVIAFVVMIVFGTPFAYVLGRSRFRGRSVVLTLVELPLVMPPAVAGIALLVAFGPLGLLGGTLSTLGIPNPVFRQAAVVMAVLFVASPFYLRGAIAAFEGVDQTLLDVAGTLGAGSLRRLIRVAVPLAGGGLGAAAAVAFARGIGEFGATILFAGSFQGTTQTLPLAVYFEFSGDNLDVAVAIGVLLLVVSGAILLTSKLLPRLWKSSTSTSPSPGVPSLSAPR
jgi:molybdate transport system permease protein